MVVTLLCAEYTLQKKISHQAPVEFESQMTISWEHGTSRSIKGADKPFPRESKIQISKQGERKRNKTSSMFTAKNFKRHVVYHDYHDHACALPIFTEAKKHKGGVATPFPMKLHEMLIDVEKKGMSEIVSWQPHGRAFLVHIPKDFVDKILPKYFKQTKIGSFQRQLNLYGFTRISSGKDKGGYYHELFLRSKLFLADQMVRNKVKGTKVRGISNPTAEPNFYNMPPIDSEKYSPSQDVREDKPTSDDPIQEILCQSQNAKAHKLGRNLDPDVPRHEISSQSQDTKTNMLECNPDSVIAVQESKTDYSHSVQSRDRNGTTKDTCIIVVGQEMDDKNQDQEEEMIDFACALDEASVSEAAFFDESIFL